MMFFLSRWPAGWSRQSRCSLAIALGVVLLLLLMCFIDIPLSRMPEPIAENAELFAEGSRITVYLTLVSGVAGLALILGIDRFMSECRALTNLVGNACATIVVARWDNALDKDKLATAFAHPSKAHYDAKAVEQHREDPID